jgi:4-hydroxy-tetrahydrodipicolinate synthase
VFVVGSQGEFWALSTEEKKFIWEVTKDEVHDRVPVYAGISSITTREAIELAHIAEEVSVEAVTVLTPFFISPNETELYDHYRAIAQSTRLPLILYTNPQRTRVNLTANLVKRLAEIENIVGIKDSSGDLELLCEYLAVLPDSFSVLIGRDSLIFSALLLGAKGAIAATANVFPQLVVKIYESFKTGDLECAKLAQDTLVPLRRAFQWGTFPVVIKEALDIMGLDAGPARSPVGPMSSEMRNKLVDLLSNISQQISEMGIDIKMPS